MFMYFRMIVPTKEFKTIKNKATFYAQFQRQYLKFIGRFSTMIEIKDYQEKAILKLKEQINELLNRESRETLVFKSPTETQVKP